jgi:dGTPase
MKGNKMPVNPLEAKTYFERKRAKTYPVRGEYYRDQTAIIHATSFRRLKHKTQVFFDPDNDHVCTRIEHVMHVATIAASICKGLNLAGDWNLDTELAYSIGLGHDLGHAPFGHAGENALNQILPDDMQFIHEINSLRVVDCLSRGGRGLNLTYAVRDGIAFHNGERFEQFLKPREEKLILEEINSRNHYPASYEGCICRFSDKVAYLGRDIEDAIVAGFIEKKNLPKTLQDEVGTSNGEIINELVKDLIETSKNKDIVTFSDEKFELLKELRNFNYQNIYYHPKIANYKNYGQNIIQTIFNYLLEMFNKYGFEFNAYLDKEALDLDHQFGSFLMQMQDFYNKESKHQPEQIILDYVSGMTDSFALKSMKQIVLPRRIHFSSANS